MDSSPAAPADQAAPVFTVVVPCYNEEGAILDTLSELRGCLQDGLPHELIIVNDGSTDRTADVLSKAIELFPGVRVIHHAENRGYGASLKTGIRAARSEWIVITDADGTYPNEEIPRLVEMAGQYDMVVGSRTAPTAQYPLIRKIPKVFLRAYASWVTNKHIPDLNSGLRVFRREMAMQFFYLISDGFSFTTTITLSMLSNKLQVHYEPIGYAPRIGKSKIRPIRDTLLFFRLILQMGLYFNPLRSLLPLMVGMFALFTASLGYDVLVRNDLTDKTVVLLMFSMNFMLLSFLADAINLANRKAVVVERGREEVPATDVPVDAGSILQFRPTDGQDETQPPKVVPTRRRSVA